MAGFVSKMNGYAYDGEHKAATAMADGIFCYLDNSTMKMTKTTSSTANTDRYVVLEKTDLYQQKALRCAIDTTCGKVCYVESGHEVNTSDTYNTAAYEIAANAYCRAHRILNGDDVIFTVDDTTYSAVSVGDTVYPTTDGKIAKVIESLTVNIVMATGQTYTLPDYDTRTAVIPFTVTCDEDPDFDEDYVTIAETNRSHTMDPSGRRTDTYTTTVTTADCSLSAEGIAKYGSNVTVTFNITQGTNSIYDDLPANV